MVQGADGQAGGTQGVGRQRVGGQVSGAQGTGRHAGG